MTEHGRIAPLVGLCVVFIVGVIYGYKPIFAAVIATTEHHAVWSAGRSSGTSVPGRSDVSSDVIVVEKPSHNVQMFLCKEHLRFLNFPCALYGNVCPSTRVQTVKRFIRGMVGFRASRNEIVRDRVPAVSTLVKRSHWQFPIMTDPVTAAMYRDGLQPLVDERESTFERTFFDKPFVRTAFYRNVSDRQPSVMVGQKVPVGNIELALDGKQYEIGNNGVCCGDQRNDNLRVPSGRWPNSILGIVVMVFGFWAGARSSGMVGSRWGLLCITTCTTVVVFGGFLLLCYGLS